MTYTAHPSAILDDGIEVGDDSRIWHFCHVCSGAKIGMNCTLGQNVFVSGKAIIGNGCKIQNNVSVFDNVVIEDKVFCGPSMVFTNVYNPRAHVVRRNEFRETRVMYGATLGANCTVICGTTIGKYAFIGAGTVVNRSVPDFALVVGVPGKQVGWMSRYGERIPLPLEGEGEYLCPQENITYCLSGKVLQVQE